MEPRCESELPVKMANLDIDMDTTPDSLNSSPTEPVIPTGRTLRRRSVSIGANKEEKSANRRVIMKPKKHINSQSLTKKEIEAIYLNKKAKTAKQTLETIFEEPKPDKNELVTFIGGRKVKRHLVFSTSCQYTKEKIKKRRAKIKKMLGNKSVNRKKVSMKAFLKVIECLDLDEPEDDNK